MKGKLVQFLLYLLAFVFAVAIKIMATDSIGQLVLACFGGVGALFLLGHFIYHQVNRHRHEEKALRTKLKIPNLTKNFGCQQCTWADADTWRSSTFESKLVG